MLIHSRWGRVLICIFSFSLLSATTPRSSTSTPRVTFDKPDIDTGKGPVSIAQADFNRDGRPDVVTANSLDNSISVLLNNGDNTFARTDYAAGSSPHAVISSDFNNAGIVDVAVAGDQGITIFLGVGDGTLRRLGLVATDGPITGLAAGDFNRDGNIDLAAFNGKSGAVSIFAGNGLGAFKKLADYPTSFHNSGFLFAPTVVTADFNNDGIVDLAVANGNSATVNILLGNGDGSFRHGADINLPDATNSSLAFIAVADFNRDGKPDLVVTSISCQDRDCFFAAAIYAGVGDGSFVAGQPAGGPDGPVAIADFNGDHIPDIAGAGGGGGVVVALTDPQNPLLVSSTPAAFPVGAGPTALVAADFTGDGIPDIVTANYSDNTVTLLIGDKQGGMHGHLRSLLVPEPFSQMIAADVNRDGIPDLIYVSVRDEHAMVALRRGDGSFTAPQEIESDFQVDEFAVADLNHDGIPDLVISGSDTSGRPNVLATRVLLGRGDGTFTRTFQFPGVAEGTKLLAVADFNGDGVPDIAVQHCCSDTLSIHLGNGDGTFGPPIDTPVQDPAGNVTGSMAIGDFDGDGKMDVVITYWQLGADMRPVRLFSGNGDGTFRPGRIIASFVASRPQLVVAADFNRDGRLDLVVTHDRDTSEQAGVATLFLGNGDGSFRQGPDFSIAEFSANASSGVVEDLQVADLNNDGLPDLIIRNQPLSVLINNGDGTFQPLQNFATGAGSLVAIADFNGDGKTDVAVADDLFGALSLLLNTTGNPPPARSDFTFTLASTNLSLTAGQSGSITASLSGQGGFSQSVAFSCAGLPQNSSCTFNPPALAPSASAAPLTLTITTSGTASTALAPSRKRPVMYTFLLPALSVVVAGLGAGKRKRAKMRYCILLFMAAIVIGLQGCSGMTKSIATPPSGAVAPAGTYAVTVNAISSGSPKITHVQTISLTVR